MKKAALAILILGIIAIVAVRQVYFPRSGAGGAAKGLKGKVGGEKMALMEDPRIADAIKKGYSLATQSVKAGSIEMAEQDPGQNDFLFPGSQVATEIFKTRHGGKVIESKTIFRSPLVIYSWDNTAQALIRVGLVRQVNNAYYIVDLARLVKLIIDGKSWSDLGLPYYGKVLVTTTDPAYSNSGAMFAGLMANVLVGEGSVADENNVEPYLPTLKAFFNRLGFMERSSLDIFEAYLTTGEGAKPLVIGYENQMIEFAIQRPDLWNQSKDKVRVLYPMPTCWSAHDLIALNGDATGLIRALSDPEIQKLAWELHGFRSGQSSATMDTKIMGNIAIPEQLDKVVPLPNYVTMNKILAAIKQ